MKNDENKGTGTVKVQMNRPGVKACGPYKAGEIYDVPADEAERLIKVKGFKKVTAAERGAPKTEPKA